MKKMILTSLIAGGLLFSMNDAAFAQLAKQNLTQREIQSAITALLNKKDDAASKAQLLKEVKALAAAKNENYNKLAAAVYRQLGDEAAATKITSGLAKKYPKGSTARNEEVNKIFRNESSSIDEKVKAYNAWLKKFPKDQAPQEDLRTYTMAATSLAQAYADAGRIDDALNVMKSFEGTEDYFNVVSTLGNSLSRARNSAAALAVYEQGAKAVEKLSTRNYVHNGILTSYANALINNGKLEEGIKLSKTQIERASNPNVGDYQNIARAYELMGQDLDAFTTLESYLTAGNFNTAVLNSLEPLYTKLNGGKGSFDEYRKGLEARIKKSLKAKYKETMIEKDAPGFTLTNMQGKTVSLKDYLGKIVVLDFWATWCGPCIMSFPGMQEAVNKYANDPEVEFLFIDTWQSEANYKELVEQFIAENGYNFHVLYDEMVDRENATVTAYGVRGIPTKVVIDQNGKIRFQSAGGSADIAVVVGEMEAKIELVKEAVAAAAKEQAGAQ